jgi:hypothetical protein
VSGLCIHVHIYMRSRLFTWGTPVNGWVICMMGNRLRTARGRLSAPKRCIRIRNAAWLACGNPYTKECRIRKMKNNCTY